MSISEPQPAEPPQRPPFQFSLRTLLLLFVVLGSSMAVFGTWGIVVFGLVVALAVGIQRTNSLSSPQFVILAAFCFICFLGVLLMSFGNAPRESSRRAGCRNKLHHIALALQFYNSENGCFPPAYIADTNGKPIHSWRVLILPFMEYDCLYKTYDLNEPWDGSKNKKLSDTELNNFICPSDPTVQTASGKWQTNYVAVVGADAAWAGEKPRKLTDLGNDPSHTIMLIEVAGSGIAWSEPREFSPDTLNVSDSKSPPVALASHRVGHSEFFFIYDDGAGVHVAMADGSVHFLRTDCLSPEDLRQVLAVGGCKNVAGGPHVALDEGDWRLNWPNIAALAVWLLSVGTLLTGAERGRKRQSVPAPPAC